jgi:hypothetical protein
MALRIEQRESFCQTQEGFADGRNQDGRVPCRHPNLLPCLEARPPRDRRQDPNCQAVAPFLNSEFCRLRHNHYCVNPFIRSRYPLAGDAIVRQGTISLQNSNDLSVADTQGPAGSARLWGANRGRSPAFPAGASAHSQKPPKRRRARIARPTQRVTGFTRFDIPLAKQERFRLGYPWRTDI